MSEQELINEIEQKGNFQIAERYRQFVMHSEWKNYRKCLTKTDGMLGWQPGNYLEIVFLKPGFNLFETRDIDPFANRGIVPLALIKNETDFLAVQADAVGAPVLWWNHEIGRFMPYRGSLDEFLTGLTHE